MKRLKDLADYRAHDSIKEPFLELLWYFECQYNYLLTIIGLLSKYGHLTRQSLPLSSAQQLSQIVHAEIIGHKRFYTSSNGITYKLLFILFIPSVIHFEVFNFDKWQPRLVEF